MAAHPTRYCSQCDHDWPSYTQYNLCPKCGRNTKAETSEERPDEAAATILATKYRDFDAYIARRRLLPEQTPELMAGLERAFQVAATIPDPTGCADLPGEYRDYTTFPDDALPDGA